MSRLEDHGEHYCGSTIVYDSHLDLHTCTGMHDDPAIVIEPGECTTCEEPAPGAGAPLGRPAARHRPMIEMWVFPAVLAVVAIVVVWATTR